jgi:response regulator RpfG family c-di-GMP phosphodiesterase
MDPHLRPPFPTPANNLQPDAPNPAARILLVDDDADLRQLNASVLKDSGYEVTTADDGAASAATLLKPYAAADLLRTVRRVLSSAVAAAPNAVAATTRS